MKNVLYITRKEVPYKVKFFNKMAEDCNLDVIYQISGSSERNKIWAKSVENRFNYTFLDNTLLNKITSPITILKKCFNKKYDCVFFGCFNEKIEIFAMIVMKIFKRKYYLNLDGDYFFEGNSLKKIIKRILIKGADKYFIAGEESAEKLRRIVNKPVIPYYFSSLTGEEIENNKRHYTLCKKRENFILVVGRYVPEKGLDIAVEIAKRSPNIQYKFVGMGDSSKFFLEKYGEISNIEVIPFLQTNELNKEYLKCRLLLLPSRMECWGLVINEAASFGTPLVSTFGSGAAVEFLHKDYPKYLADVNNIEDLFDKTMKLYNCADNQEYSEFLINKNLIYSIEHSVIQHINNL